MMIKSFVVVSLASLFLVGCNAGKNQTNIELVRGMMDQYSIKAQDWDERAGGIPGVRVPPAGTVPRGTKPYTETYDSSKNMRNPLSGDFTPDVLAAGKEHYTVFCSMCHGDNGDGKGRLEDKFSIKPASLISDKVRNVYRDGQIYHVITKGYGAMMGYGAQIRDEKARWAIVNYIRQMQKNAR